MELEMVVKPFKKIFKGAKTMEEKKVMDFIENTKKGTFQKVTIETKVKTLAAFKNELVTKRSEMVVRIGIEYSHMKINKEKITGPLNWGQWLVFGYIITHTKTDKATGEQITTHYLRMYTTDIKSKVTYYLNGKEVSKDYLLENKIVSKSTLENEPTSCFNVKLENIVSLG